MKKYEVVWCGTSWIEDGVAELDADGDLLAAGSQYAMRVWIDVNRDGLFGGDGDAGWSLGFVAEAGTSTVVLDASGSPTSSVSATIYDCP